MKHVHANDVFVSIIDTARSSTYTATAINDVSQITRLSPDPRPSALHLQSRLHRHFVPIKISRTIPNDSAIPQLPQRYRNPRHVDDPPPHHVDVPVTSPSCRRPQRSLTRARRPPPFSATPPDSTHSSTRSRPAPFTFNSRKRRICVHTARSTDTAEDDVSHHETETLSPYRVVRQHPPRTSTIAETIPTPTHIPPRKASSAAQRYRNPRHVRQSSSHFLIFPPRLSTYIAQRDFAEGFCI